jgi:hypothetical protein
MFPLKQPVKQVYSEQEAANSLSISLNTLHNILDRHVFNDGIPRPQTMELLLADVLLVAYWMDEECVGQKVVTMGRR